MSEKTTPLSPDKLIRLLLLGAAVLLVLLLTLTVLNITSRIPEKPSDSPDGSNTVQVGDLAEPPIEDGVTLVRTPDAGPAYQDSIIFVGDARTAQLINRGVLSGGTNTKQVWRSESNILNLNSGVTSAKIIFPGTGEQVTIAEAAAKTKPAILVMTLGADWGVSYLSEAEFKDCYTRLVQDVQKASSRTTIILQSIFPVTAGCASLDNGKIDTANQWVKAVAEATGCYYLNTQSILKDEKNNLKDDYANGSDGIQLSTTAYEAILSYIRTHAAPH